MMPKVGDEVTAVLDGVLATDGSTIVIRGKVTEERSMVTGDFQVQGVDGFDIRDFVNEEEEGVMWLHGHGPEIEAALRATHAMAERISLQSPPRNETPRLASYSAPWASRSYYKP